MLIGETYLPDTAELQKWYGGAAQDELQLPMDLLLGFATGTHYTADHFRKYIGEAETELGGAKRLSSSTIMTTFAPSIDSATESIMSRLPKALPLPCLLPRQPP